MINNLPLASVRPELLKTAHWYGGRYGLEGHLIDLVEGRSLPAVELVAKFLSYVRPALERLEEWETISSLVDKVLQHGNGAQRQRNVYQRTQSYSEVVDFLIAQTAQGVMGNSDD